MTRVVRFKQHDISDCGACCLGYIAARYRKALPVARIRQLVGTNQQGTTALGLIEGARALGFLAKGVKGPVAGLSTVPLPAIAHCAVDGGLLHYVVLEHWNRRRVRVMDPAVGRIVTWKRERFVKSWTGVLILVAPGDGFSPGDGAVSLAVRLWRLIEPDRGVLAQALVGAIASTVLALSMSVFVQQVVDNVIPQGSHSLLNLLGIAIFAILGFRLLLGVVQSIIMARTAQRIDAVLILGYYRHLLQLPQSFFDTMRVGEMISRVGDAVKVRSFLNQSLLALMLNPLILLFAITAVFFYSSWLGCLSVALLLPNAAVYWLINRCNRTVQRRVLERAADLEAHLTESLTAGSTLRRFNLQGRVALVAEMRVVRLLLTAWRGAMANISASAVGSLVTQGYQIALLWLGTSLVLQAKLSSGELMSCYTLAGYLTGPVTSLIGLNMVVQEALTAADRLFEVMDLETEEDRGTLELNSTCVGAVRFDNVGFHYVGRLATLHDFSMICPQGTITVLAGPSGSGKSTVLSLLQRLYLPSSGRITVGDYDLRYFSLASLRHGIAVVPQQTVLIAGSVIENLACHDTEPDMKRLLSICRELNALPFIEQLPRGVHTLLGENGANLSGGQRQRLSLIRALYREAPILLLDEPDAALDAQSRSDLKQVLVARRALGITVIIATHDEGLVSIADHVVHLLDGRIVSASGEASVPACAVGPAASPGGISPENGATLVQFGDSSRADKSP